MAPQVINLSEQEYPLGFLPSEDSESEDSEEAAWQRTKAEWYTDVELVHNGFLRATTELAPWWRFAFGMWRDGFTLSQAMAHWPNFRAECIEREQKRISDAARAVDVD